MKKINIKSKKKFLKKMFIQLCRFFDYEIIDQSNYEIPTLNKNLNDILSIPGEKSVVMPMGQIKISRNIKSLKVIFRSCTNELIMDQNKKRIFNCDKNEYTFRSLSSLMKSLLIAKKKFNKIDFEIIITDTNSNNDDLNRIKNIINKYKIKSRLIEINLDDFKNKIIGNYSPAKFANMANLYTSLNLVKNEDADLIFFVEDDYIHSKNSILEMLFTFEKFSTVLKKDIFLIPADYPYLYMKDNFTKILLGNENHWRLINESLVTFLTSKEVVVSNLDKLMYMAQNWKDPWEKPLHDIYETVPCFSPVPSLSIHCSNVNSVFGLSPNVNWVKLWEENKDY